MWGSGCPTWARGPPLGRPATRLGARRPPLRAARAGLGRGSLAGGRAALLWAGAVGLCLSAAVVGDAAEVVQGPWRRAGRALPRASPGSRARAAGLPRRNGRGRRAPRPAWRGPGGRTARPRPCRRDGRAHPGGLGAPRPSGSAGPWSRSRRARASASSGRASS